MSADLQAENAMLKQLLAAAQEKAARAPVRRGAKDGKVPPIPPSLQFSFRYDSTVQRAVYLNEYGETMTAIGSLSQFTQQYHDIFKAANKGLDKDNKWRRISSLDAWIRRGDVNAPADIVNVANVTVMSQPFNVRWKLRDRPLYVRNRNLPSVLRSGIMTTLGRAITERLPGVRRKDGTTGPPRLPVIFDKASINKLASMWEQDGGGAECRVQEKLIIRVISRYNTEVKGAANMAKDPKIRRKLIKVTLTDVDEAERLAGAQPVQH
jgi:hypothetical protein